MTAKEHTPRELFPELSRLSAELQEDGSILLADQKLTLRPAVEEDRAFVLSTWVRSYLSIVRKLTHNYKSHELRIKEEAYLAHHPEIAESLWDAAAVLKEDKDGAPILGYVVGYPDSAWGPILDYVYVIPDLRNMGVAKAMIASYLGTKPTLTHMWPFRWHGNWKYNPYLAQRRLFV